MIQEKVNEFARERGYSKAEYICKWREFQCYEPVMGDGTEPSYIGLPLVILVDANKQIRMSTPEESMQQLRETNNSKGGK